MLILQQNQNTLYTIYNIYEANFKDNKATMIFITVTH